MFPFLQHLDISHNDIERIPQEYAVWCCNEEIERALSLGGNPVKSITWGNGINMKVFPEYISDLSPTLEKFVFLNSNVTQLPSTLLLSMERLVHLDLQRQNGLRFSNVLAQLHPKHSLTYVYWGGFDVHEGGRHIELADAVLGNLSKFKNVRTFQAAGGRLYGTIPYDMYSLTKLQHLNLADAYLNGTLPAEMFRSLSQLTL